MLSDFFKKYGWMYLPGVVFLILSAWLQMFAPRLLGEIVDMLRVTPMDTTKIYKTAGLMLLVSVSVFITRYIWRFMINGNGRNLEAVARQRLFTHFQKMSVHFYAYRKTGDLVAYGINDINAIRQMFGPAFATIVNGTSLSILAVSNMAGGVHPRMAAFALLPVVAVLLVIVFMGRQVRVRFRRVQEMFATISDRVQENITGLRVIKAYVQEEAEVERFEELNKAFRDANLAMVRVSSMMTPTVDLLFGISFTISLIYGGALVRQGTITLGEFVAFFGYLSLIIQPLRMVSRVINIFSRGSASLRRYNAIMETPPMVEDGPDDGPQDIDHADVRVSNLSFRYPGDERYALKDISFHLKPGRSLGILGRTGAGKTTLVNLLVRIYNVEDGAVEIGGCDSNRLSLDRLRKPIGYVPQDNFLFSTSVEDNIRFFSDEFDHDMVVDAARDAAILGNIEDFPAGFETEVGERGMSLSGGQKQRICIARALIKKPALLIMDDSLSAVDTQTEELVLENIKKQTQRGGSAIIIAHRVSALASCDEIIVLDKGSVVERGSHEHLMGLGGLYSSIARDQQGQQESEDEVAE